MIDVLCGRHLRLRVAFTLWQRDVGELLTYFLRCVVCDWFHISSLHFVYICDSCLFSHRIQDIGAFVDFLPLISRRWGTHENPMIPDTSERH